MPRNGFIATQLIALVIVVSIGVLAFFLFVFKPENTVQEKEVEIATPQPTLQPTQDIPYQRNPALDSVSYGESSTEGWKLYKNGKFGFELLVPEDMFESTRGCCVIEADRGNNSEDIVFVYLVLNVDDYKTQVSETFSKIEDLERIPEKYLTAPEDFIASTKPNDLLLNFQRLRAFDQCLGPEVCPNLDNTDFSEINNFPAINVHNTFTGYHNEDSTTSTYSILANNTIYTFWFTWKTASSQALERQQLFTQIISSFNASTSQI